MVPQLYSRRKEDIKKEIGVSSIVLNMIRIMEINDFLLTPNLRTLKRLSLVHTFSDICLKNMDKAQSFECPTRVAYST